MAFYKQPFLTPNLVSTLLWAVAKLNIETSNRNN